MIANRVRLRDNLTLIAFALLSAALIFGFLYDVFDSALRRWTDRDLDRRAHLVGVAVESHARAGTNLQLALNALAANAEASNLAVCEGGSLLAATGRGNAIRCGSAAVPGFRITRHVLPGARTLFVAQDRTFLDARRKHFLQIILGGAELVVLALLLVAGAGTRIGTRRSEEVIRDMRERLQRVAPRETLAIEDLVVVANREPYAHERGSDGAITVERPASGLVTGIEPLLRACSGTWIAYGGGSADRDTADRFGRVAVPPEEPEYTLRRMWIGADEYERYYSGCANEALWPLCHIVHTRPVFRASDWIAYQAVNETFARAAVEESRANGLLLVQDYHFALVPKLVREQAPHVITSLFWHIPWPNAEAIGICPWKEALLEGMLGSGIVGFHTRQYCLNFLDAAQRYLECRVDLDDMSVSYGGRRTLVRPYPISVEWPYPAASRSEGAALRKTLGIPTNVHVSLGVDRADYTKGLLERVAAVETLLEENPSLRGGYVFVQLASPTRTRIRKYQELATELQEAVDRVNARFATAHWQPIVLQMRTFSPDEVRVHYAMADSAVVTPLHDGMNLVAKEYVASCTDENGALVLSTFAGAAKELDGALVVNPYDAQQVAQAMLRAIRMPLAERKARMQAMRAQIASSSISDWSERLVRDMRELRQQSARFWPQRPPHTDVREAAAV